MPRISLIRILLLCIVFIVNSCSPNWKEAIKKGKVEESTFHSSVDIEIKTGLLIVPITLKGKEYRFIFDSGAPTSISKDIQAELQFKTLVKSTIVDSEGNRKKVNYVSIDTLFINEVPFFMQTAFVGDYTTNPVLKCIGVDGIIGSNTMRYCNWTIDSEMKKISFYSHPAEEDSILTFHVPFRTNSQFALLVDLHIGKAKVKNIKIDYGSNGDLSLPYSAFSELEEAGLFDKKYNVLGYSQSGLLGKVNESDYKLTYIDSLYLGDCLFKNVKAKSKGSGLFGNHLLSEYTVTIDWQNMLLHFKENKNTLRSSATFGVGLGKGEKENEIYIQSIIEGSEAYKIGLRPLMKVRKVDDLDFTKGKTYCDFVEWLNHHSGSLYFEYKNENSEWKSINLEKEYLNNE